MDLMTELIEARGLEKEVKKRGFIMDVTEEICKILSENNITRQDLATKMGKSKGLVSQLLNGSRNMTLNTLADICIALDHNPKINLKPKDRLDLKCKSNITQISSYRIDSAPLSTLKPCNYRMAI